jgi:hypothetical protein
MLTYRSPWWLPGGHAQTIWSSQVANYSIVSSENFERLRFPTPDHDFIDIDLQYATTQKRPFFVMFHGLEGSSKSHYSKAFAEWAGQNNYNLAIPHFRGCSGEINLAPRAYHAGDCFEINWILEQLKLLQLSKQMANMNAIGISLGGNALLLWAAEVGNAASKLVESVISISAPLDLKMSGTALGQGINKLIYTPYFLKSMKQKAEIKHAQYPGLIKIDQLKQANSLWQFDNLFTAPLHGFKSADEYWECASAKPRLKEIRLPALIINACNDPFIPRKSLPTRSDITSFTSLFQPATGGHVGFTQGLWPPGHLRSLPNMVENWMAGQM